jgi:hypothetical protein
VAEACAEACDRHFLRFEVIGAPSEPVVPVAAALRAAEAAEAAATGAASRSSSAAAGAQADGGAYVAVFLPALFNAEEAVTAAVSLRCRPALAVSLPAATLALGSSSSGVLSGVDGGGGSGTSPLGWQGWSAAAAAEGEASAAREEASAYGKALATLKAPDHYAGASSASSSSSSSCSSSQSSSPWAVALVQREAASLHALWLARCRDLRALDDAAAQASRANQRASQLAEQAALAAASGRSAWPAAPRGPRSSRHGPAAGFGSLGHGVGSFGPTAGDASSATRASAAAAVASPAAKLAGTARALRKVGAALPAAAAPSPSAQAAAVPAPSAQAAAKPATPATLAALAAAFAAAAEAARLGEAAGAVYPWEANYPAGWLHASDEPDDDERQGESGDAGGNSGSGDRIPGGKAPSAGAVRRRLAALAVSVQARWGGKRLSLAQAQAVALATDERLLLVSGGPGVGKTETVRRA